MKLTASTISTASISTPTNSLTELGDHLRLVLELVHLDAGRQLGADRRDRRVCSALPSAMMSPPLAIEMPSAITSWPWWRTLTCGGST